MRPDRQLAMMMGAVAALLATEAEACGISASGGGSDPNRVGAALLVILGLSTISLLSLRGASGSLGRIRARSPRWRALHRASLVGVGISALGMMLSGGLLGLLLALPLG